MLMEFRKCTCSMSAPSVFAKTREVGGKQGQSEWTLSANFVNKTDFYDG